MSAVAEALSVELDQARDTARQRRGHEEAVTDAADRLKIKQQQIQSLMSALADPSNERAAEQLVAERAMLKELARQLQNARAALDTFNLQNPTAAELQRLQRQLAFEIGMQERRALRSEFAENLRQRCQLLDQLAKCETQAAALQKTAATKFPQNVGDSPAADRRAADAASAGIPQDLVSFLPPNSFSGGLSFVVGKEPTWQHLSGIFQRAATQWLAGTERDEPVSQDSPAGRLAS